MTVARGLVPRRAYVIRVVDAATLCFMLVSSIRLRFAGNRLELVKRRDIFRRLVISVAGASLPLALMCYRESNLGGSVDIVLGLLLSIIMSMGRLGSVVVSIDCYYLIWGLT